MCRQRYGAVTVLPKVRRNFLYLLRKILFLASRQKRNELLQCIQCCLSILIALRGRFLKPSACFLNIRIDTYSSQIHHA